ncbi:MAG: hypothetical protein K1X57_06980 [Gemmataceae bacterium]|nr:hypothetical protein [Gemmataceae bacterium]
MVKPITARVNCKRCHRRVRLPESVVSELAFRLAIETACPECGGEIAVSLLATRLPRVVPSGDPVPVESLPPPAPPPSPVELPFRPLVDVKSAPPIDVPFAPMRLDATPRAGTGMFGRWKQIPVAHRATWIAAAITVTIALCWPSAEQGEPVRPARAEARP